MSLRVWFLPASNVFPAKPIGRQLRESGRESNVDTDLMMIRTAEAVMEAINLWTARKERHGDNLKEN